MHRFSLLGNGLSIGRKAFFAGYPSRLGQFRSKYIWGALNNNQALSQCCFKGPEKQLQSISTCNVVQVPRISQIRAFSNTGLLFSSENESKEEKNEPADDKPLSQRQKLARVFAAYGTTAVVFHTSISLTSLGICYTIVSSGIDMVAILQKIGIVSEAGLQTSFASGASTFVIAYACHKVFMPVRIFLTITCTPAIVRKLRSLGILKAKVASKTT
eukprot:gene19128-21046_t